MRDRHPRSRRQFLRGVLTGIGITATPALIAACGTSATQESDTTTDASASSDAASPPAQTASQVELVWWDPWVTQEPWLEDELQRFGEANPDIAVTRVKQPKIDDSLNAALADESLPDLWIGGGPFLAEAVAEGWVSPISDFDDYDEFVQTFPNPEIDFFQGQNIFDGQTYGAPFQARSAMWNFLYANTAVLKEYGLVDDNGEALIPQTLDQLAEYAQTVTQESGGSVFGFAVATSEFNGAFWPWWWGFRSGAHFEPFNPQTGKSGYTDSNIWNRILEFFVQSREQAWIHPQSATGNDEVIRALFAEGEVAFIPNGGWAIAGWEQTHPDFTDYRPFAPPLIDTDTQLGWYRATPGGSFLRISSQTEQPEASWRLFKWFHSKETSQRWVESGNGTSIWPENNDPQYMGKIQQQQFFEIDTANTRVGPDIPKMTPDMQQVTFGDSRPNEVAVLQGVFTGQITDIDAALDELASAKDAMREQAFEDARNAGNTDVGFEYFAWGVQYPDWDPTKGEDYISSEA
ncbi:MAG: extracellular solute-binding protein [Chloroflexota bacterium]